jgi:hypothetical protein
VTVYKCDMTNAKRLKIWPIENDMDQPTAASKIGCSLGQFNRFANGKAVPGPWFAAQIEQLTGIPAKEWVK